MYNRFIADTHRLHCRPTPFVVTRWVHRLVVFVFISFYSIMCRINTHALITIVDIFTRITICYVASCMCTFYRTSANIPYSRSCMTQVFFRVGADATCFSRTLVCLFACGVYAFCGEGLQMRRSLGLLLWRFRR